MCIYGQQSQVKGFLLPRKFCQLLLRKLKQLLILISPPDFIALRDPSLLQGIVIVFDLKIPVLLVHQLSAAKDSIRSDQQGLRIPFLLQNVSKRRHLGKEMLLRIHGIFFDRYGKGQPGRLGKHRRNRPGRIRHGISAVQLFRISRKVFVFLCQPGQLLSREDNRN